MQDDPAGQAPGRAILAGEEADRRKAALARLQDALAARGVESVVVGRHAMTPRSAGPAQQPGAGDPELHVLAADCQIVSADGQRYHFADGSTHSADDPCGAAGRVLSAGMRCGRAGPQPPVPTDHGAGGRDGMGAGERALRRLCDEGII